MGIETYSTTASANGLAGYYPEDQLAPTLNDAGRQVMADLRAFYNSLEWRDWGLTITYISSTSFSVSGDYTDVFHASRRIRATGASTGTIYGSITSGTAGGGNTTVVVSWDSGSMSDDTDLAISVGISVTGNAFLNFEAGTRMLFQQNTAPSGWSEDATTWNRAIRQTNIANWVGTPTFATGYTTVFGGSGTTDNHTLVIGEVPAHTHGPLNEELFVTANTGGSTKPDGSGSLTITTDATTDSAGGGGAHNHGLAELSYIDVIVCEKD